MDKQTMQDKINSMRAELKTNTITDDQLLFNFALLVVEFKERKSFKDRLETKLLITILTSFIDEGDF